MSQDTNVENLIINKLTRAQYESIANPDPTQLYFITDDAAGGDGTWGSITGTLSNQTDLQDALDAKQDKLTAGDNIIIEQQEGGWIPAVQNSTLAADTDAEGWSSLAYGDGKLVAFSYSASDGYYLATSTDGTTWSTFAKSGLISYTGLVYDGSKFVALDFSGYVSTSTDGETWTPAVQVSNLGSHDWLALAYDGSKFVALGREGHVSTSTDGTTWTQAVQDSNLGVYYSWTTLAYDGSKFVALESRGYVSTSTDGTTWTQAAQVSNLGSHVWRCLTYDGNKLIALGSNGYLSQCSLIEGLIISATADVTVEDIQTLSNGNIVLQKSIPIYKITPSSATTFTISSSNLTNISDKAFTFELAIDMSSNVYALSFPNNVTWMNSETPDLSSTGIYFLAFRTIDGGTTWLGNLQGKW